MSRAPRRPTARIYPRIDPTLAAHLSRRAAATGVTETSLVEEALRHYLEQTADLSLLIARMDRHARGLDRSQRDLHLLAEGFGCFVKMWLAQNAALAPEVRKAALEVVPARFGQFLQYVAREVSRGAGYYDLLPRELLADAEDLEQAARDANPDPNGRQG